MEKTVNEFKKENAFLKSKCDKSDVTLIELVEEVVSSILYCLCICIYVFSIPAYLVYYF